MNVDELKKEFETDKLIWIMSEGKIFLGKVGNGGYYDCVMVDEQRKGAILIWFVAKNLEDTKTILSGGSGVLTSALSTLEKDNIAEALMIMCKVKKEAIARLENKNFDEVIRYGR